MIAISHRGNTNGKQERKENRPEYIDSVLDRYDCEIDVRYIDGNFYLGHDEPDHLVSYDWLSKRSSHLWLHCKNVQALQIFMVLPDRFNAFWHQNDLYTLTTQGYLWCYPNSPVLHNTRTICVLPELNDQNVSGFQGVCSDYIEDYA